MVDQENLATVFAHTMASITVYEKSKLVRSAFENLIQVHNHATPLFEAWVMKKHDILILCAKFKECFLPIQAIMYTSM